MERRIIAIGGGEIKNKTTLEIDRYIAEIAKQRAGGRRAAGLFIGTASHDSMPYFNSFRKTYTSVFDIKAEVALCVYGEMDVARIKEKIDAADFIYVGGGNTKFMLDKWRQSSIDKMLLDAYSRGTPMCGLSAGAICWFEQAYSDHAIMSGTSENYEFLECLGVLSGIACPHLSEREAQFASAFEKSSFDTAVGIGDNFALEYVNEKFAGTISAGGKAYALRKCGDKIESELLT